MDLVTRVKELCEKRDTTLVGLERELGFSRGSMRKWSKSSPSAEKLQKVADYFNVSTDWLLGRVEEKNVTIKSEGNLHEDNIQFKTYNEVIKELQRRLIEERIIEKDKPIPKDVLEKIIKHGKESALEILKLRKKQDK